jgi:hypothetical protein
MYDWSDWLSAHWYQIGVLIGLAILVVNTSRISFHLFVAADRLDTMQGDISSLESTVEKWELGWRVTDERNRVI